jgi:hypothetical protein
VACRGQVGFENASGLVIDRYGNTRDDLVQKVRFQRPHSSYKALSRNAAHLQEICRGIAIQVVLLTSRYVYLVCLIRKSRLPRCKGHNNACVYEIKDMGVDYDGRSRFLYLRANGWVQIDYPDFAPLRLAPWHLSVFAWL